MPPPDEPEIAEVEDEASVEVTAALHTDMPVTCKPAGDDALHSWPPKSTAQYDKSRKREGESSDENTLKMWPPRAPLDPMRKPLKEQIRGRPTDTDTGTHRPTQGHEDRTRESDKMVDAIPRKPHPPLVMGAMVHQTNVYHHPNPTTAEGVVETEVPADWLSWESNNSLRDATHMAPQSVQTSMHEEVSLQTDSGCEAKQIPPSHAYLWFDGGTIELDFEDLSFNGDMKTLDRIALVENPNKEEIGRWGE